MTKKDYEFIAAAIRRTGYVVPEEIHGHRTIAENLARAFAAKNPHFDSARFLNACGFKTTKQILNEILGPKGE